MSTAEKLDEAQERIRQLERALAPAIRPDPEWRLTRIEATVLAVMLAHNVATKERIRAAIFWMFTRDQDSDNSLKVMVSRMRKKLAGVVTIVTHKGMGFSLPPADREKWRHLIEDEAHGR